MVNDLLPLRRVFRLFNTMGLRHLPVVDEHSIVVGMITRKDFLKIDVGSVRRLSMTRRQETRDRYERAGKIEVDGIQTAAATRAAAANALSSGSREGGQGSQARSPLERLRNPFGKRSSSGGSGSGGGGGGGGGSRPTTPEGDLEERSGGSGGRRSPTWFRSARSSSSARYSSSGGSPGNSPLAAPPVSASSACSAIAAEAAVIETAVVVELPAAAGGAGGQEHGGGRPANGTDRRSVTTAALQGPA